MSENKKYKNIIVSNIGSTSRKYFFYKLENPFLDFSNENLKNIKIKKILEINFDGKNYPEIKLEKTFSKFLEILKQDCFIEIMEIDFVLERVVAAGEFFLENKEIDEKYFSKLKFAKKYDSIHTVSLINEIEQILKIKNETKSQFKIIGISDSSFHKTIKKEVYSYPLKDFYKEHNFRKYGYHGISISEVSRKVSIKYKNIIAIHLGGGGSVTAIHKGESVVNSFGMTPVSGLVSATRVGDIDPFVLLHIFEKNRKPLYFLEDDKKALHKTEIEIFEESGLFALTGKKDFRDIIDLLNSKDKLKVEKANFAIDLYLNKIAEFAGAASSYLEKVEALVLTGTILEKSEFFRNLLLKRLKFLKIKEENVILVKTEEEEEMLYIAIKDNLFFN